MGFHKIGCLRQGISNCQCPRNRVSQKLDVYFLGYIIDRFSEYKENPENTGFSGFVALFRYSVELSLC